MEAHQRLEAGRFGRGYVEMENSPVDWTEDLTSVKRSGMKQVFDG